MHLQRLEIYGFKSFAQKAVLEFLGSKNGRKGITAVVGPNGSGKSNIADAVRWVLGEQSLKTLRGKKSEDVIFAGSDKKARLGLAEVSLTLSNESSSLAEETALANDTLDLSEVVISRRLYRDGESEYLVNGRPARLHDIALLLARARFGAKTYTVIGQGTVDSILSVSPAERKEFFDEAAGVKEFQIKRQQAFNRLQGTTENLSQAENLLAEIEPRLRSLSRQVKRLSEREETEKELKELQKKYYRKLWRDLEERGGELRRVFHRQDEEYRSRKAEHEAILAEFGSLEGETPSSRAFLDLQKKYEDISSRRGQWQDKKIKIQSRLEMMKIRAAGMKNAAVPPLAEIIRELEEWALAQEKFVEALSGAKGLAEMGEARRQAQDLREKIKKLLNRLKNPSFSNGEPDGGLARELFEAEEELKKFSGELVAVNQEMISLNKEEEKKKGRVFELQRQLQAKQDEVRLLEQKINGIQIELAKLETRQETLEEEINLEMGPLSSDIKFKSPASSDVRPEDIQPQIFKLKHHLEMIGGIDSEAVAEHKETKERHDFLSGQINDLKRAMIDTRAALGELDAIIKERRDRSLKKIDEEFGKFFKILFSGGTAKLVPLYEIEEDEGDDIIEERGAGRVKEIKRDKSGSVLAGLDIQATPPGKRIKDIGVLSGGERAMTSVALICAILSHSPSPFVVLDEVDAALDESNSLRFAEIISRLSEKTQFILITHNRATMAKAHVLYGVTMSEDGVSKLLSVKLEEAEKMVE